MADSSASEAKQEASMSGTVSPLMVTGEADGGVASRRTWPLL